MGLLAVVAASPFVEYGAGGVLLCAGASLVRREVGKMFLAAGAALLCYRAGVAGLPQTFAGLCLVLAYWLSDGVVIPRARGLFLKVYAAQWAALAVVRLAVSR